MAMAMAMAMALAKLARWKLVRPATVRFREHFAEASIPTEEYEVVVIGGGCAGCSAALKAARMGFKTACIENKGSLGSTVSYQVLLSYDKVSLPNLPRMLAKREEAATCYTKGIERMFKMTKVNYMKGFGSFVRPSKISVEFLNGEKVNVVGKHTILATGSHFRPSLPPNVTIDEKKIISSTGALSLLEIPKSIVVIDTSYASLEIGLVWGRLGSKVTIVDPAPDISQTMDGEMWKELRSLLVEEKLELMPERKVVGMDASSTSGVKLTLVAADGGEQHTLEADAVLIPDCRVANIDGLCLENAGLHNDVKENRIEVDEQYKTSAEGVYAIGDVVTAGPMPPALKAMEDGVACVELIAGQGKSLCGHVSTELLDWY